MNKSITHRIIDDDTCFKVEYICLVTGKTVIEKYEVPLTKREIEVEYDYIVWKVE